MKRHLALLLTLTVLGTLPLSGQRGPQQRGPQRGPQQHARPRANQGHPPPAPSARRGPGGQPEPERFDGGRTNGMPHVNHDRWYGHDRADDPRFHQTRAFEHGRFSRVGPSYRYGVSRFDRVGHRFWLGSSAFLVAPFDWALAADWCWDCGEDFVVYDDPDHPGWYLLYNLETGGYIHVQYGG
ncbi:MAG TPA: hypothetical protein VGS07_20180 [Thermoanaerobaculia bacterium]|nr:hypothetical protein [Thermoanaerobaculia bacterium]